MRDHDGHGHHEAMAMAAQHGGPGWVGALGLLLLLALLGGAAWLAHRRGLLHLPARRQAAQPALATATGPSEAEQYLDMMLAKGEIDPADYHERRLALRSFS